MKNITALHRFNNNAINSLYCSIQLLIFGLISTFRRAIHIHVTEPNQHHIMQENKQITLASVDSRSLWVHSITFFMSGIFGTCVTNQTLHQFTPYTHTRLTALYRDYPGTRKVKPIWILLKQETVSGSGNSWAICKSAPRSRQITMPAPHYSVFYRLDALPATQPTASKHWRHNSPIHSM